jgi:hypothetical protein
MTAGMKRRYRYIAFAVILSAAASAHSQWTCTKTTLFPAAEFYDTYCTVACWVPTQSQQCVPVWTPLLDPHYPPPPAPPTPPSPPAPVVLPRPTLSEADKKLIEQSRVKADCEAKGGYEYPASIRRLSAFISLGKEKTTMTVQTSIDLRVLTIDSASTPSLAESMVQMDLRRVLLNAQSMSLPIAICSNSNGTSLLGAEITP